jgi:two-component system, OmpR family, response regulator ChvI
MNHSQKSNAASVSDISSPAPASKLERPSEGGVPVGPQAQATLHVLLCDDDNLFREALVANLTNEGFEVESFGGGQEIMDRIEREGTEGVHAIILDMKMPGMNGLEVMKALRTTGVVQPIIFLTNHTSERYEKAALENGAVDFVDKTRNVSILIARVRIAAEGMKTYGDGGTERPAESAEIGELQLNVKSARACWRGKVVPLTLTQFWIVHLLATNAGDYVPYRAIYDVVHGVGFNAGDGEFGYRVNVRSLIKRIRQRFRDIDQEFDEILNYPAFGYGWRTGDEDPAVLAGHAQDEEVDVLKGATT